MKTLQEIQDEYARGQGFYDWEDLFAKLSIMKSSSALKLIKFEQHFEKIIHLVQQEQQKLIARKAKVKRIVSKDKKTFNWIEFEIDKSSIINENNIIR